MCLRGGRGSNQFLTGYLSDGNREDGFLQVAHDQVHDLNYSVTLVSMRYVLQLEEHFAELERCQAVQR
jgi:hypothetical protein